MNRLRLIASGLLCGALLSTLRASPGLDLVHTPVPSAWTPTLFRALALVLLALVWWRPTGLFGRRLPAVGLLFWTAVGFALHALFLPIPFAPQGLLGHTSWALVLALLLVAVSWAPARGVAPEEELRRPGILEGLGLLLAGAGVVIALESVARRLRLLSMGQPEDDAVFAAFFLIAAALGAAAFGAPLARGRASRPLLCVGLTGAAAAGIWSLGLLANVEAPEHVKGILSQAHFFFARFGLDVLAMGPHQLGTLNADVILAGQFLLLPAFALGVGLCGADRSRLRGLLLGAAGGQVALHLLLQRGAVALDLEAAREVTHGWSLFAAGTACTAIGSLVALFAGTERRGLSTWGGGAFAVGAALFVLVSPPHQVLLFSPWFRVSIEPSLVIDAPEGLYTVEPWLGLGQVATLDRRRLTPIPAEEELDARRLELSWNLLDPERRLDGQARVLLIGQLSPSRAFALERLGIVQLERTAPWFEWAADLERELFGGEEPPPGELLSPAEACERIAAGRYDLIVVPPLSGPVVPSELAPIRSPWAAAQPPRVGHLSVPPGTLAVVWLDGGAPLSRADLGGRGLLAAAVPGGLSLGVVLGELGVHTPGESPQTFAIDGRFATEPALLAHRLVALALGMVERDAYAGRLELPWARRLTRARAELTRRLADGARGGAAQEAGVEEVLEGIALHFAGQRRDSQFTREEERTDIVPEALAHLRTGTLAGPPDAFLRHLWEDLGTVMVTKRLPEELIGYLLPVADTWQPWPELDLCAAEGWLEFGEQAEALALLERAAQARPYDLALLQDRAYLLEGLGRHAQAAELLREALSIQPGRADIERLLAMALLRAGDPEGLELARQALEADPEDQELRALLEAGPPAPDGSGG